MIIDAANLLEQKEIHTDVCIIGSGPAGLVLAKELHTSSAQITLLESGLRHFDIETQELNKGDIVGEPYNDLRKVRCREIGGTINIWNTQIDGCRAAKYVPLDPIDFEARAWLPYGGWPFDFKELLPWYRKAQLICGLGAFDYDADRWTKDGTKTLPFAGNNLVTKIYQFGTADQFLKAAMADLESDERTSLVYRATVTEIHVSPSGERAKAVAVAVAGHSGHLTVRAKIFVLATGAIENARLLLLSDRTCPSGLGNKHGCVGRFFMEHPRDYSLQLLSVQRTLLNDAGFYDQHPHPDGTHIMGRISLSARVLRQHRLPQASATIIPEERVREPRAFCMAQILRKIRWRERSALFARLSRPTGTFRRSKIYRLLLNLEQLPDPGNRIRLGNEIDMFGRRRVQLHWRWTKSDQERLATIRRIITDCFEYSGLARVTLIDRGTPDPNAHHHAGTTRMSDDPRIGVVDHNSQVHGIENLFVAGASVFPTSGFANPMLTIVALAARLSRYLQDEFKL